MIEDASPHRQRGFLLAQQGRAELAEREYRMALSDDPHDAGAHALLALLLADQEERQAEALEEARAAIALAPDEPFPHFAEAQVHLEARRWDEAERAAREAVRIEPDDADLYAVLAASFLGRRRWAQALEAADQGLAMDPSSVACANIRASALVQLGRRDEAGAALSGALARDPDNSHTHANSGWARLHAGDRRGALAHFRESLRLDPNSGWAREGLVEALKASNPIYAAMLRYFLWMQRLEPRTRWMIVLGGYFGFRVVRSVANTNPRLYPWLLPLMVAYGAFLLMSWTAPQLFNAMLLLNREGRAALSDEQLESGRWVGGGFLLALGFGAAALATGSGWLVSATILGTALLIPLAATFTGPRGRARRGVAAFTAAAYALGALAVGAEARGGAEAGDTLFGLCIAAIAVFTWVINLARPSDR